MFLLGAQDEEIKLMLILLFVGCFIISILVPLAKSSDVKKKVKNLSMSEVEMSTDEFFKMRNNSLGGRGKKHISTDLDYAGVYILTNKTKGKPYIGQSQNVIKRVNDHLTGHGNGNVYADFCYGDVFTVRTISLASSGYDTLNSLERDMIAKFGAYDKGYNKTRGNRG